MADLTVHDRLDRWNEYSKKIGDLIKKYDALLTNAAKLRPHRVPKFDEDGKVLYEKTEGGADTGIQQFDETMPPHPIYGRLATKLEIDEHMIEFAKQFDDIIKEIQSLKT